MKKGEIIDIKVIDIDLKGISYGIVNDMKCYININAGINQIVRGMISKIKYKNNKIYLNRCEIIDYANKQNSMFDILEKQASGCSYQFYSYEEQLKKKNYLVKNHILNTIGHDFLWDDPISSIEDKKYRNKMEFSFGNEYLNGPIILGLHKQNSFHDIYEVDNIKLMDNNFNNIYMITNNFAKNSGYSFYHKLDHTGLFRNLVIRKSDNNKEILVNLITTSEIKDIKNFQKEYTKKILNIQLENNFKISGILHTINDNLSDSVNSDKEYILYGKRDITEKIFDLNFNISPYSFFQTNTKGVTLLYQKVLDYLQDLKTDDKVIFDLFSGTGTISQIVSKKAKKVYGIEIVEEAIEKAIQNAKENNIQNVSFICGDVFEKLDNLEKPDLLIVDPPRAGILTKTIEKLVKYKVDNILYISCNPITLAKDLLDFKNLGYSLKKGGIVDMFPYTKHVETVVLLTKVHD